MTRRVLCGAVVLAGCVSVSKSVLIDRSDYPVPRQQVQVFLPGDSIPASCQRVALLHASGEEGFTNEGDLWNKLREEAGKLGANYVQLGEIRQPGTGERVAAALIGTRSDRDADAVALWCPDGPP